MKVKITEIAFKELGQIHLYIAQDSSMAARAVVVRIRETIARLGEFPYLGRPVNEPGIRVFPVRPFPYLIFYTVEQQEVIIRNVRHAGRIRL